MHVIARRTLREFWNRHPAAQKALEAWFYEAEQASWESSDDVQATHKAARSIGKDRVIFNIRGNHYRLIVRINYKSKTVFIKIIGTHAEYDRIEATSI